MNVILRNQVNDIDTIYYEYREDEKLKVVVTNTADETQKELYYDLSNVEYGKHYVLDEYVIYIHRDKEGLLSLTLLNYVKESDFIESESFVDIDISDFESPVEWKLLEEVVPSNEINIYEENNILKQELKALQQTIVTERRNNEAQMLEIMELMMGII